MIPGAVNSNEFEEWNIINEFPKNMFVSEDLYKTILLNIEAI